MKRNSARAVLAMALFLGFMTALPAFSNPPRPGDKAPLVSGLTQDGKDWNLADLVGKKIVILYFYPKDGTPGCTKEACGFRDRMTNLNKDGVEVVGVSMDTVESHKKFTDDQRLNFTLIADPEGKIVAAYGAEMPVKKMARRISFLIDKEGKIVRVVDNPDAEAQLTEMKEAVLGLKSKP